MNKLTFTGHETFHCRHFWLKKGYDFLKSDFSFTSDDAVVKLGVGKNMVASINFWMRAFSLKSDQNELTAVAHAIFDDKNGFDPFLEYEGTLWLLQYHLIKSEVASIYTLFFKEFRKTKVNSQFTVQQLLRYLAREAQRFGSTVGETTLKNDIKVFIKTYLLDRKSGKQLEDDLTSIFIGLNLIDKIDGGDLTEGELYQLKITERRELPCEIFLYMLLDCFYEEISISFDSIQSEITDSLGCNAEGLEHLIARVCDKYDFVVYKEDAGRKEVQIKGSPQKWNVLEDYYNAQVHRID